MSLINQLPPKQALEAIEELNKSVGWAIVQDFLSNDVLNAAVEMGENPTMTMEEVHFRRGKIGATRGFTELPEKLKMYFENQISLTPKE